MFDFIKSLFKPKPYPTPIQWQIFAIRHSGCAEAGTDKPARYDTGLFTKLQETNRKVNAGIKPRNEASDTWSIWPEYGDCDDYAITKLAELIKRGFPVGSLRMAICKTETGENHAVLVVVTDQGEYVLDNRTSQIKKRSQTGYKWIAMATADPNKWVKL